MPNLQRFSRWPRPRRTLVIVTLVVLVACSAYLVLGPKPWQSGIAAAEAAAAAAGEPLPKLETSHFRISGLWLSSLANIVLCLLVLGFSRWLTRPLADPKRVGRFTFAIEKKAPTAPPAARRWISACVLASVLFALTGTLPRMGYGLWHDEDKTVRNFIVGQHLRSKTSGEVKFRPVTWEETLWNHRTPNHTLYGILARLSHNAFPRKADPAKPYLNEWSLRLPALLGGLGGLALLAAALASLGFHRAAAIAPLLLAVHPWFLRYASEARGYGLLFLFVPLCVFCLSMALRNGRWKWWISLGVAEFLTVYSVLNGMHFLIILNLAALTWIATSPGRGILIRRWLVTCAVAAVLGIQFMGAFLPQFKNYVESTRGHSGEFDRKMAKDNLSSFAVGIRYQSFEGHNGAPSFKRLLENEAPIRTGLLTLAVLGLTVAGAVRLCRAGPRGIALLAICLLPAPLFYIHAWVGKAHIFYWYTIVGLPLFWALFAIGAGWLAKRMAPDSQNFAMPASCALAVALAALLFWAGYGQRRFQLDHPIEATRESVYATRQILDPTDPRYDEILTINISRHPMVYDGAAHAAKSEAEFLRWLKVADETSRPLFINFGAQAQLERNVPDLVKYIEDPKLFKLIDHFPGIDPGTDRTVKKYIPGSAIP